MRQEFVADTDPTNKDSVFEIREVAGESTRWITFVSSTARVYSVQYLTNELTDAAWKFLVNPMGGSNAFTTVIDTNAGPIRIYRIQVNKP